MCVGAGRERRVSEREREVKGPKHTERERDPVKHGLLFGRLVSHSRLRVDQLLVADEATLRETVESSM